MVPLPAGVEILRHIFNLFASQQEIEPVLLQGYVVSERVLPYPVTIIIL